MLQMIKYFPTKVIQRKFERLSDIRRKCVLETAKSYALDHRSELDYKPQYYAILMIHFRK